MAYIETGNSSFDLCIDYKVSESARQFSNQLMLFISHKSLHIKEESAVVGRCAGNKEAEALDIGSGP